MKLKLLGTILTATLTLGISCTKENNNPEPPIDKPQPQTEFATGADISWVTQMEKEGIVFKDKNGKPTDCFALMKDLGINSIRLRVWVDPSANGNWCNKEDLLIKAKRANTLGLKVMVDFHYSDWWADPGKQNKPASWKDLDLNGLCDALASHTKEVLELLKANNITPEWVQVGNETSDGMLWEDGRASTNMAAYATLTNTGYKAVKEVFPQAIVIVHLNNGFDAPLYKWLFDGLKNNNCQWDMIGMSLYPSAENWESTVNQTIANMMTLSTLYNKPIMICEVGMPWDRPQECYDFLTSLIQKGKSSVKENFIGVFYWEPECNPSWNNYTLGAFDSDFKPTKALDAFKETK